MLLWMLKDEFLNFWHPQEQSLDLTSGYTLNVTHSNKFPINHAVSWNLSLFSLTHFGHISKITKKFSVIFYLGTFLYDWKWHYDQIDLRFFGHFTTTLACDQKSSQKQVETRSREMCLIFRTAPLVVHCMAAAPLVATALYFNQNHVF